MEAGLLCHYGMYIKPGCHRITLYGTNLGRRRTDVHDRLGGDGNDCGHGTCPLRLQNIDPQQFRLAAVNGLYLPDDTGHIVYKPNSHEALGRTKQTGAASGYIDLDDVQGNNCYMRNNRKGIPAGIPFLLSVVLLLSPVRLRS